MLNSTINLNISLENRLEWLKAEEESYKNFINVEGNNSQNHIYTAIQNESSDKLMIKDKSMLIKFIKSLFTIEFSEKKPYSWYVCFNELYKAIHRFSLTEEEVAEIAQYVEVPKRIDSDLSGNSWTVVAGKSSGLQTDLLGREKQFIFVDMDSTEEKKPEATDTCIKVWEGFIEKDGSIPGVNEGLANAQVMAASKEMYEALLAVMSSGVILPEYVEEKLNIAFDKANGDYLRKI